VATTGWVDRGMRNQKTIAAHFYLWLTNFVIGSRGLAPQAAFETTP
jgi:hypothetical protein